ncbi:MAG: efflux RND transporter periplasmic adaptor subunit [Candidatus Riflebacteria bacterium]|nr:efflux RND transporter periplasmic adaptor subunit [Candidatus Riflebacteria bacterium]
MRQGPRAEDKRGARAEVDRARASVRRANLRLADTKVRAPFPGTVMQKLVVEGTNVTGGSPQGTTLCVFADISVLRALVDVPEGDLPRVRAGQDARVFVRAHPARAFAGRVTNVFPFVDARSRNGKVEIEVPNATADLVPGMFVKVEIDPTIQASKPSGSGTGRI